MIIEVTQEDIDKGIPSDSCACPVFLACKRSGLKVYVVNNLFIIYIDVDGESRTVLMPYTARKFINKFDYHVSVEPFSFELEGI